MLLFTRCIGVLIVVAATVVGGTVSVYAQENGTRPTLAELRTVSLDFVVTFNGEPGVVCHERSESANRYHGTCHELVTANYPDINIDYVEGRVREYIYYDGKYYERYDNDQTWTVADDPEYDPNLTLNTQLFSGYISPTSAVVTNVGRTTVNGVAATQYQFWSTDAELNAARGGQYVYDVFVSDQNYVLKDQDSWRGSLPMGEGQLEAIWTYSDFNVATTVSPPPAESVQAASVTANSARNILPSVFVMR